MKKIILSLLGLFTMLLLSTMSYAQSVCPHCGVAHGGTHQSPSFSNADANHIVRTISYAPGPAWAAPVGNSTNNVNLTRNVSFTSNASSTGSAQALAQQKANLAASTLNKGHVGGSFGPATHEGVGFSSESAQQAIDAACYSGSPISAQGPGRPRLGTATARGSDGWYSCLLCL